jgi:hypothetical protein
MAIGGGLLLANFASDNSTDYGGSVNGSFTGASLVGEFAMGGTPAPGLVIGGGIYWSAAPKPGRQNVDVAGPGSTNPVPSQNVAFGILGPFVDYYIDPKGGWHIQGALGLGGVSIDDAQSNDKRVQPRKQGGFGFMLGGGYEAWVANQWSLGGMLRLMYASTETNGSDSANRFKYEAWGVPELLFTATYH